MICKVFIKWIWNIVTLVRRKLILKEKFYLDIDWLTDCPSVCLCLYVCWSIRLIVRQTDGSAGWLNAGQINGRSNRLNVCKSVCLSVCPSVCLSVCLSGWVTEAILQLPGLLSVISKTLNPCFSPPKQKTNGESGQQQLLRMFPWK